MSRSELSIATNRPVTAHRGNVTATYILADQSIDLTVSSALLARRIRALWWRHFAFLETRRPSTVTAGRPEPPLEIVLGFDADSAPPWPTETVSERAGLTISRTGPGFWLEAGSATLLVMPGEGGATGHLEPSFFRLPQDTQRDFFLSSLVMLLRNRGRFGVYASGVERDGRGVLIAGPSGSGKTTLALSLVAQGWNLLSYDVVALRAEPHAVTSLALRRSLSCSPRTLSLLNVAPNGADGVDFERTGKLPLDVASLFPDQMIDRFKPTMVLFPEVTRRTYSDLVPIAPAETVSRLGPASAGIMTGPVWAKRQLDVLGKLAAQVVGYQLLLGRDVFEHPEALSTLLETEGR